MQFLEEDGKTVAVDYELLDLWYLQQNNLKTPIYRDRVGECVLRMELYGEVATGLLKYWMEWF
ncbi:hypothetical protein [Microcoleus sp. D2_18a_D3]|uniref:hypothetical protein n=1 Tax=Microcoleus sp. D2_18a_D3 TaxID=3055330 RepID=UPI002FD32CFB